MAGRRRYPGLSSRRSSTAAPLRCAIWRRCATLQRVRAAEVIRLQAVYSAVAMGGSIAVMTVFAGFLTSICTRAFSG